LSLFFLEDGDRTFIRNIGTCPPE